MPKFDPNKPFVEVESKTTKGFDPNKPFTELKKKDSEELPLNGEEIKKEQPSLFQSEDVTLDGVVNELNSEFYKNNNIVSPEDKKRNYDALITSGSNPKEAAIQSGFSFTESTTDGVTTLTPSLTETDKQYQQQAIDYAKSKVATRADEKIKANEVQLREDWERSSKTPEDLALYKNGIKKLVQSKYGFGLIPKAKDRSDDEIKQELKLLSEFSFEAYEDISSKYKSDLNMTSASGFSYSVTDPNSNEYKDAYRRAKDEINQQSVMGKLFGISDDTPEMKDLEYNHELLTISKNIATSSTDLIDKMDRNFFSQAGISFLDYFGEYSKLIESISNTDSFKSLEEKINKIEKGEMSVDELSDTEYMTLGTMRNASDVATKFTSRIPEAVKVGESIGHSLGFMVEMFATAGVGSEIGLATKQLVIKGGVNALAPTVTRQLAAKSAQKLTEAGVRTLVMPNFVKNTVDRYSTGQNLSGAIFDGYMDTYVDVVSESLFGTKVGKVGKMPVAKNFLSRVNSSFGNVVDPKSFVTAAVEEWAEEQFAGIINGYRQGAYATDFSGVTQFLTDFQQQRLIAESIGVMSVVGGGTNVASKLRNNNKYNTLGKQLGESRGYIDEILSNKDITLQDADALIMEAIKDDASINELSPEEYVNKVDLASKYINSSLVKQSYDAAPQEGTSTLKAGEFTETKIKEKPEGKEEVVREDPKLEVDYGVDITTTEEGESVNFDDKTFNTMLKLNNGESVSGEDLDNTRSALMLAKEQSKSKENKGVINEYIDQIDDLVTDGSPKEYNTKPFVANPTNKVIDPVEGANKEFTREITVSGNKVGTVQQSNMPDGTIQYKSFDANDNIIDTFEDSDKAYGAVVEHKPIVEDFTKEKSYKKPKEEIKGTVVSNKEGAPLLVMHGTDADFSKFDMSKRVKQSKASRNSVGFFFTSDPTFAKSWGNTVKERYLNFKNPLSINKKKYTSKESIAIQQAFGEKGYRGNVKQITPEKAAILKEAGFDGIIGYEKWINPKTGESVKSDTYLTFDAQGIVSPYVKPSPSVKKVLGVKDKVVSITDREGLKLKLRAEVKGAKGASLYIAKAMKDLTTEVKDMANKGHLKSKQASALLSKMGKTNMTNPVMRERFLSYADKVFENADNIEKIKTANTNQRKLRKAGRSKDKDALTRKTAQQFTAIDPLLVDDLDAYNEMATKLQQGAKKSSKKGVRLNVRQAANLSEINSYIDNTLAAQEQELIKRREDALNESIADGTLLKDGEISEGKVQEMEAKNKEAFNRNLNIQFSSSVALVDKMLKTNKDPFTGEDVDVPVAQRAVMEKFVKIDEQYLSNKDKVAAIDAMNSFLVNHEVGGMEALYARYEGVRNINKLINDKITAQAFATMMYPLRGWVAKQITTLPVLMKNIFRGQQRSEIMLRLSGLREIINGANQAQTEITNLSNKYADKYSKTKPNGEGFYSIDNVVERGMYAYLKRTPLLSDEEMKAELEFRKSMIEASINKLNKGNKIEKQKAESYEKAYGKFKDVETQEKLDGVIDETNKKAVEEITKMWQDIYPDLSNLSLTVYNNVLENDMFYNPDTHSRMSDKKAPKESFELIESAFANQTGYVNKRKSGVLMGKRKFNELRDDRYIDLLFEKNTFNNMKGALTDLNTASAIHKMDAFLKSDKFDELIPDADTRGAAENRLIEYVKTKKGVGYEEGNDPVFNKYMNEVSKYATQLTLGSLGMVPKQTLPVITNTIANAGSFDVNEMFKDGAKEFIDNSGYPIANRGISSFAIYEDIDKGFEKDGVNLKKIVDNAGEMMMKTFLEKPDAAVARTSWLTYYKNALRKQGVDTKNIDWTKEKINKKAADYAQDMVDAQQNVSDVDLQGKMFRSRNWSTKLVRQGLFTFASFRMNQTQRLHTDIAILGSKNSSIQDKKAARKSLAGTVAEIVTFNIVSNLVYDTISQAAYALLGEEPPEEKIEHKMAYAASNLFSDLISPVPIFDYFLLKGANMLLETLEDGETEGAFKFATRDDVKAYEQFGLASIVVKNWREVGEVLEMYDGEYTQEMFGKDVTRKISDEDKEVVQKVILPIAILRSSKLLPADLGTLNRKLISIIKRGSQTEKQVEKEKEERYKKSRKGQVISKQKIRRKL